MEDFDIMTNARETWNGIARRDPSRNGGFGGISTIGGGSSN